MRTYAEDIQVRLHETGAPGDFVWRGRRFRVTEVLSHWMERTAWWRLALTGEESGETPGFGSRLEDEVWRVEAATGRSSVLGVYDLAHKAGQWQLRRVMD